MYARRYGIALAASLLVGLVAVLVPRHEPLPESAGFTRVLNAGLAQVDELYAPARAQLRRDIEARVARLPAAPAEETRRALEALDAASRQLREILARDPGGAELLDELLESYQRELELLELLDVPEEMQL